MTVFFDGGEGEIRTLEPFYRLHDFQSCALDQLGDFSIFCLRCVATAILIIAKKKSFVNSKMKYF